MADNFNSNFFDSFTSKASDMDEYQKHLVNSMKEIDKVKINQDTLKLIT